MEKSLQQLCENGTLESIKEYAKRRSMCRRIADEYDGLKIAIKHGRLPIVKYICEEWELDLANPYDKYTKRPYERTFQSIRYSHKLKWCKELLAYLLEHTTLKSEKWYCNYVLETAVSCKYTDLIKYVYKNKLASTYTADNALKDIYEKNNIELVKWICKNKLASSRAINKVLDGAAQKNDFGFVKWLCEEGNATPLDSAALSKTSSKEIIAYLCDKGSDPSPHFKEMMRNSYSIQDVEHLRDTYNIDIAQYGGAAIVGAAAKCNLRLIQWLVDNGADPTYEDNQAVVEACKCGYNTSLEVIQYLCKVGCDPACRDSICLSIAVKNSPFDVVQWLSTQPNVKIFGKQNDALWAAIEAKHCGRVSGRLEVLALVYGQICYEYIKMKRLLGDLSSYR